jgi:ATP-binding cassette, subfamily C, bacteriocin exporter
MRQYKKAFIRQHEQTDCGVACLASLVRFYGGDIGISRLRELSGTNRQGTTMLGLFQAAQEIGLNAEAFEADAENLKKLQHPSILHVVMENMQHYVICYGFEEQGFIISDPAWGLRKLREDELLAVWKSRALLVVVPGPEFQKADSIKRTRWYWIKKLIEEDINILAISLVIGIAISILSLSTAVFSQKLIDDILPHKDTAKLIIGFSLLGFLLFVKTGLGYIRASFLLLQGRSFNNRIIGYFCSRLLYLPKSFFDNRKVGELIARMNDTGRIQSSVSYIFSNVMIDVLLIVVSSAFILSYSAFLGLLALSYIPLYFTVVYFFNNGIISGQQAVMSAYARNESNYVDTMQGIGVIKAMNRESYFSRKTGEIYNLFQQSIFDLGKVKVRFNVVSDVIGTVIILCIIGFSSFMVVDGEMKLGAMMAVLQMIGALMPAAGRLAMTNIQLQEAKVAFDRMYEFTSLRPEYLSEEPVGELEFKSLKVSRLSFRFPGRKPLLEDISIELHKGEMVVIAGESGCGKSTLLQVLQKFYPYESGEVLVNSAPWSDISTVGWRNAIGSVPQDIRIFNGTLLENIAVSDLQQNQEETGKIVRFCREYGFERFFQGFPMGYLTVLGEGGVHLSGGQQQLVALARALYKRPRLLLLDEATSAMDRKTESWVLELLNGIKSDVSVIFVTHRMHTARKADRIYVIENGRTTVSGKHEELLGTENLYSSSWKDYS